MDTNDSDEINVDLSPKAEVEVIDNRYIFESVEFVDYLLHQNTRTTVSEGTNTGNCAEPNHLGANY